MKCAVVCQSLSKFDMLNFVCFPCNPFFSIFLSKGEEIVGFLVEDTKGLENFQKVEPNSVYSFFQKKVVNMTY